MAIKLTGLLVPARRSACAISPGNAPTYVRRCPRMSAASDTPDERQSELIIRGHHQRSSHTSERDALKPDEGCNQRSSSEVFIGGHHIPPSEMRSNLRPSALAIDLPSEVLPTPGGPTRHLMREAIRGGNEAPDERGNQRGSSARVISECHQRMSSARFISCTHRIGPRVS